MAKAALIEDMIMKPNLLSIAFTLCLALGSFSALAAKAGEVTLLAGRATAATPDGVIRALNQGDPVFSREFISTESNSFVNIKFADGGAILIKPNSRFHIEQFAYAAPSQKEKTADKAAAPALASDAASNPARAFFSLLKGGFRAVSGLIGKMDRGEYRVTTPIATIGIRGTDYTAVLCDAACASDPVVMESVGITTNPQDGLVASVTTGGIGVAARATIASSSLRTYRALAQALHLEPAGLALYRGQFIKVAAGDPQPYAVNSGETFFFPKAPNQPPVKLPGMTPNIDSGLKNYSPEQICK
jgi:hypothetical protein